MGKTLSTEEFINRSVKVHGNKYNYSKTNYIGNHEKVIITCKRHGDFTQTPNSHIRGIGCAKCSNGHKTPKEFIEYAIKIHGNRYDYSKTNYINDLTKVTITCKIHGDFSQLPANHLKGNKCKQCSNKKLSNYYTLNSKQFIRHAIKVHGNKYTYANVNYISSNNKVSITCKKHGDFLQTPKSHMQGGGCPKCVGKNKTTEEFINECSKIHKNLYTYGKTVFKTTRSKIIITCKKHGDFLQTASSHLSGCGCRKCSYENRYWISNSETNWLNALEGKYKIKIIRQHEILFFNKLYIVDGYCKETNTVYEFNGDYWHGNPKKYASDNYNNVTQCTFGELYNRTINKEKFLINLGYNVISIWEDDYLKIFV